MVRKQMNIRLDDLTRAAIKRIAAQYNMSESQVITRGVLLLEQSLKNDDTAHDTAHGTENKKEASPL